MHFSLSVLHHKGDFVDNLLEPFGENSEEYFTFNEIGDIDEIPHLVKQDLDWYKQRGYDKKVKEIKKLIKTGGEDLVDFYLTENGYSQEGDGFGYYENVRAIYDWYTVGGRWNNWIITKDGKETNSCFIKDFDKEETRKKDFENWKKELSDWAEKFKGTETGKQAEERLKIETVEDRDVLTYSILVGGEVTEIQNEEEYWNILSKYPDYMITIVDCHI